MRNTPHCRSKHVSRLLTRSLLGSTVLIGVAVAGQAQAQTRVVSACSGVQLPASVVTDIVTPVVTGITGSIEGSVNGILADPLLGLVRTPLDTNATGLLTQAANGDPITLQVLDTSGNVVGPTDQCRATADSISLDTPAGVAIGGNQITGLGAEGATAFASDVNAIAFGNGARAEDGAAGSLALGTNSSVTAANSVALGAGSVAGRGAIGEYAAPGVAGTQTSVGEVSVGAPGALRQITNVAAGTAATDAATVGQVTGVADQVAALDAATLRYDSAARDRATLGGATGTVLANVAPGAVDAASTEAVNGGQLFATNQGVAANADAIAGLDTRVDANEGAIAALQGTTANAVQYDVDDAGVRTGGVTLAGATPGAAVTLGNVGAGTLAADSTQAVNGAQLFATNEAVAGLGTQVGTNAADIAALQDATANAVQYDVDAAGVRTGGVTFASTTPGAAVTLGNVGAGTLAADSTQAVNGGQLFATNAQVAANTAAIEQINVGGAGPVRYSSAAAPTTPGVAVSNDVTLVGADPAAAVALHNVAAGAVAEGSTDAVNGGQLFAVSAQASNSVQYDRDASGARTNRATLAGTTPDAAVTLANVAGGQVDAASTEAVNGGQLYAVGQTAQAALTQAANSVQYDSTGSAVTLGSGGAGATPVALRNVAAGTAPSDAVNVAQLQSGMNNLLAEANSYVDGRLNAIGFDLRDMRRDLGAGTSAAMAVAALPQAMGPGATMVAIGGGTYRGQSAVAFGASRAFNDGQAVVKVGGTYDSRGRAGANAGVGFQF